MNTRHFFLLFSVVTSGYGLYAANSTNNPPGTREIIMNNKDMVDHVSISLIYTREKNSYDKESWDKILRLVSTLIEECDAEPAADKSLPSRIGNFSEDLLKIKGLGIHGDLNIDVGGHEKQENVSKTGNAQAQ